MAFKPNYNQQRRDRTRAKEQKKQEKQQRRQEEAAKRKADRPETEGAEDGAGSEHDSAEAAVPRE